MFIICVMLFIDSDISKDGHQHLLKIKTHTTFLNFSLANWVTFKVNFILKDISPHIKSSGTRYSISYHRCMYDSISSPFHLAYMKLDLSAISHFPLLSAPRNPHYFESGFKLFQKEIRCFPLLLWVFLGTKHTCAWMNGQMDE